MPRKLQHVPSEAEASRPRRQCAGPHASTSTWQNGQKRTALAHGSSKREKTTPAGGRRRRARMPGRPYLD